MDLGPLSPAELGSRGADGHSRSADQQAAACLRYSDDEDSDYEEFRNIEVRLAALKADLSLYANFAAMQEQVDQVLKARRDAGEEVTEEVEQQALLDVITEAEHRKHDLRAPFQINPKYADEFPEQFVKPPVSQQDFDDSAAWATEDNPDLEHLDEFMAKWMGQPLPKFGREVSAEMARSPEWRRKTLRRLYTMAVQSGNISPRGTPAETQPKPESIPTGYVGFEDVDYMGAFHASGFKDVMDMRPEDVAQMHAAEILRVYKKAGREVTDEEAMKEAWRIVKHGRQSGRNPWLAAEEPHKFVMEPRISANDFVGSEAWLQYGADVQFLEWFKRQWIGMPLPKYGEEVVDGSDAEWRRELVENIFYSWAAAC